MNQKRHVYWLIAGMLIGIGLIGYDFPQTSANYSNAGVPLTMLTYLFSHGLILLVGPISLSLFAYFGYYKIFLLTFAGGIIGVILNVNQPDIAGVVVPGCLILGFIVGVVAELVSKSVYIRQS